MQELRCKKCGLTLEQRGDKYVCLGCGAEYQAEDARRIAEEMARLLDEQKQERVANLRQQLWKEFNEDYIDDDKLIALAREIRSYLPEDFFATFCELACGRDYAKLNAFLVDLNVKEHADDLEDIVKFMFKILRPRYLLAMNNLLERGAQVLGNDFYNKYYPILARESQKLEEEVYNPLLPRDVFVMYSSADMKMVISLVEELEKEGLRCFVAARNIQHGRKSDYNTILQQAMDSCKVGLFVSTNHSRSHECDALSVEMEYIRREDMERAQYAGDYAKLPRSSKKPRVEYVAEPYCGRAVEKLTKELFAGFERCTSVKDVIAQVYQLLRGNAQEERSAAPSVAQSGEQAAAPSAQVRKERVRKPKAQPSDAQAAPEAVPSPLTDFMMQGDTVVKYLGIGGRVRIPDGVKAIGEKAFEGCEELKEVVFPASLQHIGAAAFRNCLALSAIVFGHGSHVISIEEYAFSGCRSLKAAGIPRSVKKLDTEAFSGCSAMTDVVFEQGNTMGELPERVFAGCTSLRMLVLPRTITKVALNVFDGCRRLKREGITAPHEIKEQILLSAGLTRRSERERRRAHASAGMKAFRSAIWKWVLPILGALGLIFVIVVAASVKGFTENAGWLAGWIAAAVLFLAGFISIGVYGLKATDELDAEGLLLLGGVIALGLVAFGGNIGLILSGEWLLRLAITILFELITGVLFVVVIGLLIAGIAEGEVEGAEALFLPAVIAMALFAYAGGCLLANDIAAQRDVGAQTYLVQEMDGAELIGHIDEERAVWFT